MAWAAEPAEKKLHILDEPAAGLHLDDTKKLLAVLHTPADRGTTVVVIEHQLGVAMTADWVIDLGPEGGDEDGRTSRGKGRTREAGCRTVA